MELSKRLEQLVGEAAAQEGRLEMTQVLDHFRDVQMTPEEMEDVYLKLERKGVHIQAPEMCIRDRGDRALAHLSQGD